MLKVCIDNENSDYEEWILEKPFEALLNDGCVCHKIN